MIGILFRHVVITDASPPSNDVCNDALMISSIPYENIVNNISNATYSRDDFTTDVVVEDRCYAFFDLIWGIFGILGHLILQVFITLYPSGSMI